MKTISHLLRAFWVFVLCLVVTLPSGEGRAQVLLSDDFDSSTLSSQWTVQRGYATLEEGWVRLQGSTLGRDAFIMAGEGSSWSNYKFSTRFHSDGGGNNWYNSLINFRVQSQYGWSLGTFYSLYIFPPNSAIPPADSITLVKFTSTGSTIMAPAYSASGILTDGDNTVDVTVIGGHFDVVVNGTLAASYVDSDPIPTGGVALGAIWESVTRYDYARVTEVPTPASLVVAPNVLSGGKSGIGTVTLTSIAEADTVVTLASSNPSAAYVPASVTVPGGHTAATFPVTTSTVTLDTPITLSATLNGVTTQTTLLVTPSKLTAVSLLPPSVRGGISSTGIVTLSVAAPTGGYLVSLSSSDPSIAAVPASVIVRKAMLKGDRGNTATFTVTTRPVATPSTASITATFGGISKSVTLSVMPPDLISLSLNPPTLIGGETSTGTVFLNGKAPEGGIVLSLFSNNPAASVPATVTVRAGASAALFPVTTYPVPETTSGGIHAIYRGIDRAANLTVKPPTLSTLTLSPPVVKGGLQNSYGTITLTGRAPAGGIMVALASSNTWAATVPVAVVVPAGSRTVKFTATTSWALFITRRTVVTATLGNTNRSFALTVLPL